MEPHLEQWLDDLSIKHRHYQKAWALMEDLERINRDAERLCELKPEHAASYGWQREWARNEVLRKLEALRCS